MADAPLDPLYWDDAYPIALLLKVAHPDIDPIGVDQRKLHEWVIRLAGFADDPQIMRADWLEQILAEWVEITN